MVRQEGYAAARYLDNSEQQVRKAYQHIEAAERADWRPRHSQKPTSGSENTQKRAKSNLRPICALSFADTADEQEAVVLPPVDDHAVVAHAKPVEPRVAQTEQVVVREVRYVVELADNSLGDVVLGAAQPFGGAV